MVSIERRQLEICELLFEIPLSADSNVSGCHTSNVFAAFVEYITKKNVGMLRNVQPAGMSGMDVVASSIGCRRLIAVLASIVLVVSEVPVRLLMYKTCLFCRSDGPGDHILCTSAHRGSPPGGG